jgi:hypothetical protein
MFRRIIYYWNHKKTKLLIAILLLPSLWSSVRFGGDFLIDSTRISGAWPWAKMAWFLGGFVLWLMYYALFPRPFTLYVFEHELSHAIAIWMSGGRVFQFKFSKRGGHVISDKTSAFIALAPYFMPLYPIMVGIAWFIANIFWHDAPLYSPWFLFVWGMAWSFHLSFTFSMLQTDQSDFSSQGYFFSGIVVLLVNWWILFIILGFVLNVYSAQKFATQIISYLWNDYAGLVKLVIWGGKEFLLLCKSMVS